MFRKEGIKKPSLALDDDFEEDLDAYNSGDEENVEKLAAANEEEEKLILANLNEDIKKEAENVADSVFGALSDSLKKTKTTDAVDMKVFGVI